MFFIESHGELTEETDEPTNEDIEKWLSSTSNTPF